jgi:hypothetical protein
MKWRGGDGSVAVPAALFIAWFEACRLADLDSEHQRHLSALDGA